MVERKFANGVLAIATHAHSDHIGGIHEFTEGAMHDAEAEQLVVPGQAIAVSRSGGR